MTPILNLNSTTDRIVVGEFYDACLWTPPATPDAPTPVPRYGILNKATGVIEESVFILAQAYDFVKELDKAINERLNPNKAINKAVVPPPKVLEEATPPTKA